MKRFSLLILLITSLAFFNYVHAQSFSVQAAHTGSWYDPDQSGHGFLIEILNDELALVWWFTFDPDGNRTWIGGVGTINGDQIEMDALEVRGGVFPPLFDADAIERVDWGTITITFINCTEGIASWSPLLDGYEAGEMPLIQLTAISELECTPPAQVMGLSIPKTETAPIINGAAGEAEWQDAVQVDIAIAENWTVPVRLMSDSANLYILYENLGGPGNVNDVMQAQATTLFPELFIDIDPAGEPVWGADTHWFHISFQDCYVRGSWNVALVCNPSLVQWQANNWPLPLGQVIEIAISYERLNLTVGDPVTLGFAASMTSALLSTDTYHNWPADALVDQPGTWSLINLPGD